MKNSIIFRVLVCAAGLCTLPMPGQAQEPRCLESETVPECSDRLAGRIKEIDAEARRVVDEQTTKTADFRSSLPALIAGLNTGDSGAATITDYLPLLRLLLDTGGSTTDSPDKLGAEWNNPLPLGRVHQHKLAVVLEKSEMFTPLKEALQSASFGDEATNLEDAIDQGDDVLISLSYSHASENMGRDPDLEANHATLSAILHETSTAELESEASAASRAALVEREEFINENDLEPFIKDQSDPDKKDFPISKIPRKFRERYIALTTAHLLAAVTSVRSLAERLRNANFYSVIDLVNNQPQLVANIEYRARDEVVGPDEFSAVLSYESGGPSMKTYRKHKAKTCGSIPEISCMASYLDRTDVKEALANGSVRYKFSAEYSQLQRMEFSLANTAFTYLAEPVEHLTVSASLGRYFGRELVGRKRARLDATASYEDFSDDPLRQDRGLAKITVTYPVSEGFFLSLGAVYATKPEFRGEVDEEISARAGFTYKVIEE